MNTNTKIQEIKYVGFYDLPDSKSDRVCDLAATNKMNYICSSINRAGYYVNIISPSWMGKNTKIRLERQHVKKISEKIVVTFCPSWVTQNKLSLYIKIFFTLIWLFLYLVIHIKKSEIVLVYHVQWISLPIRAAKFIKRFKIILEVEEIYGEVWSKSKKFYKMEKKLISCAESYIFVSDILKERLNQVGKKSAILYGSYNVLSLKECKKNDSQLVRLIYAGSIDLTKGAAYKAVEVMKHLPDKYKLHILGRGSSDQILKLQELINEVNVQRNKEICIYDGILHGNDYTDYLSQCDIALNTQIQGEYMITAFPSKIVSYLSHNLRVVSTVIESIKNSLISSYIFFSNDDKPQSIAEAIMNIDFSEQYDSTQIIRQLDKEFVDRIKHMLES